MSRETKVPSIPEVRADNAVEVLRAIKSTLEVREGRNGNPLDQGATLRDLIALGIAKEGKDGAVTTYNGTVLPVIPVFPPVTEYDPSTDYTTPPQPTNLRADGGFTNVFLQWDGAPYQNHAYTEIWRGTTDNLGSAVLVGTTAASVYADAAEPNTTYYYWIRFVSVANVIGPYNMTSGTVAQTALDVSAAISAISQNILSSQLFSDLSQRIANAEAGISTLNTSSSSASSSITTLLSRVDQNSAALQIAARVTDGLSSQYTVKADVNGYVTGYGFAAQAVDGKVKSSFIFRGDRFAIGPSAPPVWSAATTYAKGDTVTYITGGEQKTYSSKTDGNLNNLPTNATYWTDITSILPFMVLSNNQTIGGVSYPAGTYINTAFIANATITSAKIQSLVADKITTGSLTASVGVSTGQIYGGVNTAFSLGTANFGTGFYLGLKSSTFQFFVGSPTQNVIWDGTTLAVKGTVTATAGAIGGCLLTSSQIYSSNYVAGSTGWKLGSDGSFEASNGTFRGSGTFSGSVTATSGAIGGCTIASNSISSSNYVAGSAGWSIGSTGSAEFNSVTIRGDLRSSNLFTGSTLKDYQSNQLLDAAAVISYQTDSWAWTSGVLWPGSTFRFYGPNNHSTTGVTRNQRVRSSDLGQLVTFLINVNCQIDHYFTVWYRVNSGTWVPIASQIEPQNSYGAVAISYAISLGIGSSDYIDFGISPTDTAYNILNASQNLAKYLTMSVTAFNI